MNEFTSLEISNLFLEVLQCTSDIPDRIIKGQSKVDSIKRSESNVNLTDMRLDLAEQVLRNMSQYTSSSSEIFISCDSKCHNRNTNAIHIVVGPVINPLSGKKDTTTSYQEYLKLRQIHVKSRERQSAEWSISEEALVKSVICYDFLHSDITKPVQALGLKCSKIETSADSSFREAIKVLYNRSRVANILVRFQERVNSTTYPDLPNLASINFKLLRNERELRIIKKHITKFPSMINSFDAKRVGKIIPKLWQFLLFLSQDYSTYYGEVRILCVSNQFFLIIIVLLLIYHSI